MFEIILSPISDLFHNDQIIRDLPLPIYQIPPWNPPTLPQLLVLL